MAASSDLSRRLRRAARLATLPALATVAGLALNLPEDEAPQPPLDSAAPVTLTVPARPSSVHLEPLYALDKPEWSALRHGDAAAAIAQQAGQHLASGTETAMQPGNPFDVADMAAALARARVVTVSMLRDGPVDMEDACRRFEALPGIVVQSAGNNGHAVDTRLQGQYSSGLQCADLILRVGATHDGALEAYSDRSTPDLLGENPFRQGFAFAVSRTGVELRATFAERRAQMLEDYVERARIAEIDVLDSGFRGTGAARDAAVRALKARRGAEWDSFRARQAQDFDREMQPVEDKLVATAEAQAADQRLAGLPGMRQLLSLIDGRAPTWRDGDNRMHNSDGTSWSGPAVGGSIGAALARLPELSDEDAVVAALVTARKTTATQVKDVAVDYRHTARGLSFDSGGAGFGLFDPDGFAAMLLRMEAMRQAAPATATHRVAIAPQRAAGDMLTGIAIPVRNRGVALRGMVLLTVEGGALEGTILSLVAPDGTRIDAIPARTRLPDGRDLLSLASSGMLGSQTSGTWHVLGQLPAAAKAELRLVAVQPGSVADRAIDLAVVKGPQPLAEAEPVQRIVHRAEQRWSAQPAARR